jgi:hypothetical protein
MIQLINEERAYAAITEDGDLVVYGIDRLLSCTDIDTAHPNKSMCQYFQEKKYVQEITVHPLLLTEV